MNLQPVPVEDIPLGKPLPWRLYNRYGHIVFAHGEMVGSREQLESLLTEGLMRDADAPPQTREFGDLGDFSEVAPAGVFPPAGIKPQPGSFIQLHLLNRAQQTYYSARLIGYIKNVSILVTTPVVSGTPLILTDGEQVEVRMVTGSNIYAFQTSIQRLCVSPAHYMHLDYPVEVRVQKLRKSPWVRVNLGVTVSDTRDTNEVAHLVNLSTDGAQLRGSPALGTTGTALRLSLQVTLDEMQTTLNLEATVLHVHAADTGIEDEENMLEYGIAFRNISTAEALWLKGLVYRHIAEGYLT